MSDQARKQEVPTLTRPELLSVLKHPTRVYALGVLTDRAASPKEIATDLNATVRHVSYHLKKLEDLGLIELVSEDDNAAGGRVVEHFYRATKRFWIGREAWESLDVPRSNITASLMGLINDDIAQAILAGTFDDARNHISRSVVPVDEKGYEELLEYLVEVIETIIEIKKRAADRMTSNSDAILTMVNIIQFDVPFKRDADGESTAP